MKRNRKAEAKKQERLLSRQETEAKRQAVLLTEMEAAAGVVLQQDFAWEYEQIGQFLDALRALFAQEAAALGRLRGNDRLKRTAQLFGLCGLKVLKERFDFGADDLQRWLDRLIEVGNEQRAAVPVQNLHS